MKKFFFFAFALLTALTGCNKGDNPSDGPSNIYFYGYMSNGSMYVPVYWKNDEAKFLSDPGESGFHSFIYSMTEIDGHLYCGGKKFGDAVYWIDDQMYTLTHNQAFTNDCVNKIIKYNDAIYMCGKHDEKAVFWVNGKEQQVSTLTNSSVKNMIPMSDGGLMYHMSWYDSQTKSTANGMYVISGGFTSQIPTPDGVCGTTQKLFSMKNQIYAYCESGVARWNKEKSEWEKFIDFSDLEDTKKALVSGCYSDGTDLYLYGSQYTDALKDGKDEEAVYWKNGKKVIPETPGRDETYNKTRVASLGVKNGKVQMVVIYIHNGNEWYYSIVHDGKAFSMDAGLSKPSSWHIQDCLVCLN